MNKDVVVIGAGMVGLSFASALAQQVPSLSVALVAPNLAEKLPRKSTKKTFELADFDQRVSAISTQNQQFLLKLGAWEQIPSARICHYNYMQVWDGLGTSDIKFDAHHLGYESLGAIIENIQIEQALRRSLAKEVEQIPLVVKYVDSSVNSRTPVVLENGQVLQARLVVAADGANSPTRTLVGFTTREWEYRHHALVCNVKTEKPMNNTAWQRFRPQGPLAFLPLGEGSPFASIVCSTNPEEASSMAKMSASELAYALAEAFEHRLGKVQEVSSAQAIPLRQRHAKQYFKDGVVLIGDAAHSIHPLAGQGVNLGFKDAAALVEVLSQAHAMNENLASKHTLSRYQSKRMPDNLATMAAMEGFKRLYDSQNPIFVLARNQGMRLFNQSDLLKKQIIKQACGV